MGCEFCLDPDGVCCMPVYGAGATYPMHGYTPDPDEPGMGVWWCPRCEAGKPENHPSIAPGNTTIAPCKES